MIYCSRDSPPVEEADRAGARSHWRVNLAASVSRVAMAENPSAARVSTGPTPSIGAYTSRRMPVPPATTSEFVWVIMAPY
jgi:hypothetical protein